jgi:hypothetical protein
MVAQYREGCERDELYDERYDKAKGTTWRLGRRVICEQVSTRLGSVPNAPQVPEVFTPMLIEELVAFSPSATQLEAACRWLRRNCAPARVGRFTPRVKALPGPLEYAHRCSLDDENEDELK